MTQSNASRESTLGFPLSQPMRTAIVEHARREAPRECCGVIVGRHGAPVRVQPMKNIAEGNRFYEIDPQQLIDLEFRQLPKDDLEIVAIYHSHPESPAYPSPTDVELAYWPEAIYLICSLEFPDQPTVRGFRIRDQSISEVALDP